MQPGEPQLAGAFGAHEPDVVAERWEYDAGAGRRWRGGRPRTNAGTKNRLPAAARPNPVGRGSRRAMKLSMAFCRACALSIMESNLSGTFGLDNRFR